MSEMRETKKPFSANTATAASRMRWYLSALRAGLLAGPMPRLSPELGSRFTKVTHRKPCRSFAMARVPVSLEKPRRERSISRMSTHSLYSRSPYLAIPPITVQPCFPFWYSDVKLLALVREESVHESRHYDGSCRRHVITDA